MALDRPDIIRRSDGPKRSDAATLSTLRDESGLPREVYALLAQANLLRMRGRWEEAVGQCMAALHLTPDSPSAQSLLGDIYENQGRFDDAIQWYRMALDANPDSPADRLKLDRLLQRQTPPQRADWKVGPSGPDTEAGAAPEAPTSGASAPGATAPDTVWRRLRRDPETALRVGALAAAVLVCLVIVFAYAAVHRRAALASFGFGVTQEVKAAPIEVSPISTSPAPAGGGGTPRDSAEQAVLGTLRGSSDLSAQGVTVEDVQYDPRAAHMTITLGLPSGSSLTQASALRGALRAARAGAAASPSATSFTLRVLMTPGADGAAALVFVGDLSGSALPGVGAAEPDDDHIQALFTNPWWSPQMPG